MDKEKICNAYQIFISETVQNINSLSPKLQYATHNFRNSLPKDHEYKLYDKSSLIDFIKSNFGLEVLKAFNKLKPFAYKKDLASYCIAYQNGGWYSDITIKIVNKLADIPSDIELVCFRDHGSVMNPLSLNYGIQTSLFYSKKGNPIFSKAIEYVLENCINKNYGVSPICPTGPGVLGRAFAFHGASHKHIMGTFLQLSPFYENKNKAYLIPDGTIIALHKDAWIKGCNEGDLSSLIDKGTNNYVEMYTSGNVYES
tara:strand:- start:315 stop:1082 length:768 start_codon:yes stop_codon:yes gene_type:complete